VVQVGDDPAWRKDASAWKPAQSGFFRNKTLASAEITGRSVFFTLYLGASNTI